MMNWLGHERKLSRPILSYYVQLHGETEKSQKHLQYTLSRGQNLNPGPRECDLLRSDVR
jgi:hypothetical protein